MSLAEGAGERAGVKTPRGRLGPILAGGAGTALIAGAVIALLSTVAFIGIGLFPGGGDEAEVAVDVGAAPAGAPEAAAIASAPAPDAVAAEPAAATAVAPPLLLAGAGAVGSPAGGGPAGPGNGGPGPGGPTPGPAPAPPPPGSPPPGPGSTTQAGALQGTVRDLDHTVSTLGLDVRLDPATAMLTRPLDQTLNGTLNGVGSLVGAPRLGNDVDRAANSVTGGLLGPGGLTDALLRRRR